MNNENLTPFTKENAKEYGKKGGIASGKIKARNKSLKEQMKILLDLPPTDIRKVEELKSLGFNEHYLNNKILINLALLKRAMCGDTKAYILISKLISSSDEEKSDNIFAELFE